MLIELITRTVRAAIARLFYVGIVTDFTGGLVWVRRLGEETDDGRGYARLGSYPSPAEGDRVLVLNLGIIARLVIGDIVGPA